MRSQLIGSRNRAERHRQPIPSVDGDYGHGQVHQLLLAEVLAASVIRLIGHPVPGEEQFIQLVGAHPALTVDVQAVGAAPRYHVDIETDDVDAETARLLALGAVEIDRWLDCHILRAPGGHLLCVVPIHTGEEFFAAHARTWP